MYNYVVVAEKYSDITVALKAASAAADVQKMPSTIAVWDKLHFSYF